MMNRFITESLAFAYLSLMRVVFSHSEVLLLRLTAYA